MGLDGVELVIEIEGEFGLTLADDEVGAVRTIGNMVDLVTAKLSAMTPASCRTRNTFFSLRNLIREQQPSLRLRPSTTLGQTFPHTSRRRDWSLLRQGLGKRVPHLELASGSCLTLVLTVVTCSLAIGSLTQSAPIGAGVFVALAIIGGISARPLAREFSDECHTLGDLARLITPGPDHVGPNVDRESVMKDVVGVTCKQLGTRPEKCHETTRFVEDLGMD